MAYVEILASSLIFSLMFVFQRRYNQSEGEGLTPTVVFTVLAAMVQVITTAVGGGAAAIRPGSVNWFSLLITLLLALNNLSYIYMSSKAFRYADMTLFAMLAMLGGMAVPSFFGIVFCNEKFTVGTIICIMLVVAAVIIGTEHDGNKEKDPGKKSGKALLYYLGVFFSNGLNGVFAKINQSSPLGVESNTYLMFTGLWQLLICSALIVRILMKKEKLLQHPAPALFGVGGYALCTTGGNFLLLLALETLPASVQYPFSTGGTIIFAAVVALCFREKIHRRTVISVILALAASVIVVLC